MKPGNAVIHYCKTFIILTLLILHCAHSVASVTHDEVVQFLIPGSEGGGWDTTARVTGNALLTTGIAKRVIFNNYVGAGGGRALMDFVKSPNKYPNTLMIQSTPLLLRNLTGVIDLGYRDVIPICTLIAEYQALVVPSDSKFNTVSDLIEALANSPARNPILGGSSMGSLDHITLALIANTAELSIPKLRYIPTDGGGDAMELLKREKGVALISGLGEVIGAYKRREVKILGITSSQRLNSFPEIKTFLEQGIDVEFSNWRGFFVNASTPADKIMHYKAMLEQLNQSKQWQEKRVSYQWQPLFLEGAQLTEFLIEQEELMKNALFTLGIE